MAERREWENDHITDYWLEHFSGERCTLCGNTGIIDTRGRAISHTGEDWGRLNWCICPNGQAMRHHAGDKSPSDDDLAVTEAPRTG